VAVIDVAGRNFVKGIGEAPGGGGGGGDYTDSSGEVPEDRLHDPCDVAVIENPALGVCHALVVSRKQSRLDLVDVNTGNVIRRFAAGEDLRSPQALLVVPVQPAAAAAAAASAAPAESDLVFEVYVADSGNHRIVKYRYDAGSEHAAQRIAGAGGASAASEAAAGTASK